MASELVQTTVFDSSNVGPKVTEFSAKQAELMPVEFNSYVNVKATLASAAPRLTKPNKKTSADLLAELRERQGRIASLKLKEQTMQCKRSILATQIHFKNVQLGQPSPQIVRELTESFEKEEGSKQSCLAGAEKDDVEMEAE